MTRRLILLLSVLIPVMGEFLIQGRCNAVPTDASAVTGDSVDVKVSARKEGQVTHFYVKNSELSEVTMTFDFSLVNLRGDVSFPFTKTFGPGETEAFTLSPIDSDAEWDYSYTNYYKLGSNVAVPDEYVYSLPYEPGTAHRITQGYNGAFSHTGADQFAIDWQMPEGTVVLAARGGLVVKTKDDSERGGPSMDFDRFNNYVLIRHSDGTLGQYCHLLKGGVKVVPGQFVHAGDPIALSGNTGFSSGPHLHFCVFKTRDGRDRESVPGKFRDDAGTPVTLVEGVTYRAAKPYQLTASLPAQTSKR